MRIRRVSHFIVLPTALADVPIPMRRFKYQPVDEEGQPVGTETYKTVNEIAPNARVSIDGTKMLFGIELDNIFEAITELAQFPDKEQLQVLSHNEVRELVQTEEWTNVEA